MEQRLPDEPLVLLPTSQVKKIGTYQDLAWIRGNGPEALVSHSSRVMCRSAEYGGQVNQFLRTCQDMQSSNDGRTWTMTLRKGARFSDGSPMTTEDVAFFVEDVAQYEPFRHGDRRRPHAASWTRSSRSSTTTPSASPFRSPTSPWWDTWPSGTSPGSTRAT